MRACFLGLAVIVGFSPAAVLGAPLFPSHDDYSSGNTTIGVGIGDIDGDGDPDLIGANGNGNSVTVMKNRGDGHYDVLASYPAGAGASAVVMRDWNADGFTDLAVACRGSNVFTVYLGRGDASLDSRLDVPVGTTGTASDIAAADFDRDGRFDVAVTDPVRGVVRIYTGNGDGTFALHADWSSPSSPQGLAAADLNGDGVPDIAAAGGNSVSVLLGEGDGTLGSTLGPFGVGSNPVRVAVGDLDEDGFVDLVTANRGPAHSPDSTISLMFGSDDGVYTRGLDLVTMRGPEAIGLSDLDGDGVLDIAAVHVGIPGFVSMFPGQGDGSFGPRIDFGTGASPRAISIQDLNADGHKDVATANYFDNTLSVLLNSGTVTAVESDPVIEGRLTLAARMSPVNREVLFTLRGAESRMATLTLYDVQGRLVARIFEGNLSATGSTYARWNCRTQSGSSVSSGVYLARLESGSERVTLRIVQLH